MKQKTGQKGRALFHPIRIALTGSGDGPELDLLVPAMDRGAELDPSTGIARVIGARERAQQFPSMIIYGINAVSEALKAGRVVSLRAGRRNDHRLQQLLPLAEHSSVPIRRVSDDELNRESGGSSHQGVIADVSERRMYELHDIIEDAHATPPALIVVLDGIEDPHNFGAILRTCDAVGAHGVVRQTRHSAPLSGATTKHRRAPSRT